MASAGPGPQASLTAPPSRRGGFPGPAPSQWQGLVSARPEELGSSPAVSLRRAAPAGDGRLTLSNGSVAVVLAGAPGSIVGRDLWPQPPPTTTMQHHAAGSLSSSADETSHLRLAPTTGDKNGGHSHFMDEETESRKKHGWYRWSSDLSLLDSRDSFLTLTGVPLCPTPREKAGSLWPGHDLTV